MRKHLITLSLPVALLAAACGDDERPVYPSFDLSLLEVAQNDPNLSTFAAAIEAAELTDAFGGTTSIYTVFAPTNAAFAALEDGPVKDIVDKVGNEPLEAAEIEALSEILRYHTVGGKRPASLVVASNQLPTITSTVVTVRVNDSTVTIGNSVSSATLVSTDAQAFNGILHTIDAVLMIPPPPPGSIIEEAGDAGLTTLLAAVETATLTETLDMGGPFTVFAPTEAAFMAVGDVTDVEADVIANILLHHVVAGTNTSSTVLATDSFTTLANTSIAIDMMSSGVVTVGGSTLSANLDIEATNGIIHLMDAVIVPPTILEVAVATSTLSTLVEAVGEVDAIAAALSPNTLAGEMPLTVFAPTNGAFDDAGIDPTMTSTDTLAAVLSHHAVVGQALSTSLEDGQVITTLNGDITVNIDGDDVTLTDGSGNTVNVIATDIRTLTGVVHLIDGVLIPE